MNRLPELLGFCGWGFRNVGDDAFLTVLADQFLRVRRWGSVRVTSDYSPQGDPCVGKLLPIYQDMSRCRGAHLWRLLRYGRQLDAACLFGGSVLHEGSHFGRESWKLRILRLLNPSIRIGAVGVSIGPFHSEEQIRRLVRYLQRMDYVSVRDSTSLQFLESHRAGIRCERHFDVAALLLQTPAYASRVQAVHNSPHDSLVVGIAPCQQASQLGGDVETDLARCNDLSRAIRRLAGKRTVNVRLFEFCGHARYGDAGMVRSLSERLQDHCRVEVVPYRPDPIGVLLDVGNCDVMVSMRLHSAVFAFLQQVPVVQLSYHPKCRGFAADLQLEHRWTFDVDPLECGALVQAIEDAADGRQKPAVSVQDAVASARRHVAGFLGELPSVMSSSSGQCRLSVCDEAEWVASSQRAA